MSNPSLLANIRNTLGPKLRAALLGYSLAIPEPAMQKIEQTAVAPIVQGVEDAVKNQAVAAAAKPLEQVLANFGGEMAPEVPMSDAALNNEQQPQTAQQPLQQTPGPEKQNPAQGARGYKSASKSKSTIPPYQRSATGAGQAGTQAPTQLPTDTPAPQQGTAQANASGAAQQQTPAPDTRAMRSEFNQLRNDEKKLRKSLRDKEKARAKDTEPFDKKIKKEKRKGELAFSGIILCVIATIVTIFIFTLVFAGIIARLWRIRKKTQETIRKIEAEKQPVYDAATAAQGIPQTTEELKEVQNKMQTLAAQFNGQQIAYG